MADIRRSTADIQPTNFVRPGVTDTSTATAVENATKLGDMGFELDRRLAKERFGEALETLRTQFITSEAEGLGLEDDLDIGEELAGTDKRSLKDFEQVLKTQDSAVSQGRMSQEAFRIRAERLYRVAISKRPGLANEFRTVAANYLGMDVVGATVDEILRLRNAEEAAKTDQAKTVQEMMEDSHKFQREEYVKYNIPGAEAVIPGTPQAAEFFSNNVATYNARRSAAENLRQLEEVDKQNKAVGNINRSASAALYNGRVTALVQDWPAEVNNVLGQLEANGQLDDPNAVEAGMMQLIAVYDNAVGELEAAFSDDELEPSFKATQRERFSFLKSRLEDLISGERNAEWTANAVSTMKNSATMAVMENDDLALASVISNLFPAGVAERMMKDQEKHVKLTIADLVQKKGSIESNTRSAAPAVRTLIGSVWPRANAVPAPEAVDKAVDGMGRALTSFFLADSIHFKPESFSKDGTKEGVLSHMNNHARTVVPTLSDQQRADLTSAMGGAVANSVQILINRLYAKAPGIREKLDRKFFAPDGKHQIFKPVRGAKLSEMEQAAVDEFNRQANVPLVNSTMKAYSGMKTDTEVWNYIAALYPDMREAQKRAKVDEQKNAEAKAGSQKGPSSKWWRLD